MTKLGHGNPALGMNKCLLTLAKAVGLSPSFEGLSITGTPKGDVDEEVVQCQFSIYIQPHSGVVPPSVHYKHHQYKPLGLKFVLEEFTMMFPIWPISCLLVHLTWSAPRNLWLAMCM